jgi:hypothetical protein
MLLQQIVLLAVTLVAPARAPVAQAQVLQWVP